RKRRTTPSGVFQFHREAARATCGRNRRRAPAGAVFKVAHRIRCGVEYGATIMKIAQVCPLYESCPPKLYGGTERIVFYLTEELVRLGHAVTLFASGDSCTSANLE